MSRRRSSTRIVLIFVSFCLLLSTDSTFFSPSEDGSSRCCHTLVFANAASLDQNSTSADDEEILSSSVSPETSPPVSSKGRALEETFTFSQIVAKAGRKGLGGGLPGAIAGIVQVFTLMGLRTVINYQMRYGTTFLKAVDVLYRDGGIPRFYRGLGFALIQAPLSRFVSTAANDGVKVFLAGFSTTKYWGPGLTTLIGAFIVGIARMILMPIDTCKTVLQVDSKDGFKSLLRRLRAGHVGVLYQGAVANAISSIMAHYPWFYTYNFLSGLEWLQRAIPSRLLKNASVGLVASVISDTTVNVFRVIKTTKQALGSKRDLTYSETVRMVLAADGWRGLFGRGLRTRILANALQSIVFTIIWRGLAERWGTSRGDSDGEETKSVS